MRRCSVTDVAHLQPLRPSGTPHAKPLSTAEILFLLTSCAEHNVLCML